jgi:hypothetical protein
MRLIWHAARAAVAFALAGALLDGGSTRAAEIPQPLCFSGVCLGAEAGAVAQLSLTDLKRVADPDRDRRKAAAASLATAFPRLSTDDRNTLLSHSDSGGRVLLDARTLPILLRIDRLCASGPAFVALFVSESGHQTSVRFEVVEHDGKLRLGVTEMARSFRVKAHSSEEGALLADLSLRYGFRIDDVTAGARPGGTSVGFERGDEGFRLSFTAASGAVDWSAQPDCQPPNRIKID